jgi:5-aminolevulinate synthase
LLREALDLNGVEYAKNDSHITPIPVREAKRCRLAADALLHKQGVYLQPINYPTVPKGDECLRIIITSRHQPKHINHLAHSLKKVLYEKSQTDRTELASVVVAGGQGEKEN